MAKLHSIFVICTILCCLNLPINAFNRTKSFRSGYVLYENETFPRVARSKDRLIAISFEKNTIIVIAIDGGDEFELCPISTLIMDKRLVDTRIKSLGNGKMVVSTPTGTDDHLRGRLHSYIIVDPFDCSSLVEFKSFGGHVVPYYDSFDIVYYSLGEPYSGFKPRRYNDKGKVIKLDRQIDAISYQHNGSPAIQSIEPFDGSKGYLSRRDKKLIRFDSEMKQLTEYSLHDIQETLDNYDRATTCYPDVNGSDVCDPLDAELKEQKITEYLLNCNQEISFDYGRATTCYLEFNGSHVCVLLDADLKVQATVKLNDLEKISHLHTVNNLPDGTVVVVRSTRYSNEFFHGTVIHPDGGILKSRTLKNYTSGEGIDAFVLSTNEFCVVFLNQILGPVNFDLTTMCIDLTS